MDNLRLQVILQAVDKFTAPFKSALSGANKLSAAISQTKGEIKGLEQTQRGLAQLTELQERAGQAADKIGKLTINMEGWRHAQAMAAEKSKVLRAQIKTVREEMAGLSTGMKFANNPEAVARYTAMFTDASNRLHGLNRELEWSSSKQKEMAKKVREGNASLLTLNRTTDTTREHIARLGDELHSAGVDTNRLADEEQRLKSKLQSTNQTLDAQQRKMQLVSEQQRRLTAAQQGYERARQLQSRLAGTGAGLLATGAATGAVAIKPVLDYAQAEDAATGLKVAMMGAGGQVQKEFGAINDLATQLGNRLPGTSADFQNMMSALIKQGISAQAILGGVGEATAYLAVQMKLPYEQAADFSAQLQDATRTGEQDMMRLMDTIQRTYYTGVDPTWMLQGYAKLSAGLDTIRQKGLAGAQAMAPLLAMANQAGMTDGGSAGNALTKIFRKALDTDNVSKAVAAARKSYGVAISLDFSNGQGEFGGMEQLFEQLAQLKDLSTSVRNGILTDIFGDDAETSQMLSIMINKGMAGYREMEGKMAKQADLQTRVNAQLGTLKNLWDAATGTFTNALVLFGEAVAPELKDLVDWLGRMSERLGTWAKDNPILANRLMKTAGAIAAVTVAAGGLALAASAVLGPFAMLRFSAVTLGLRLPMVGSTLQMLLSPLRMLTTGVIQLGAALLATPVGWILAAIAAIAVAALLIYKYWEPIKAFFAGVWQGLREGLDSTFTALAGALAPLKPLWDGLVGMLQVVWDWFGRLVEPIHATKAELQAATDMGKRFGEGLAAAITFAIDVVTAPIKWLIDSLKWVMDATRWLMGNDIAGMASAQVAAQTQAIAQSPALANGYLTGNYGQPATAGSYGYNTGGNPPAMVTNYQPLRPATQTRVVDNSLNAPITIHAAPGMDTDQVGRIVEQKLQQAQQRQAARQRARIGDID